jgi:hypothetical protein
MIPCQNILLTLGKKNKLLLIFYKNMTVQENAIKVPVRAKKQARKEPRVESIKDAGGPECFWVNNGPVVKNLVELLEALEQMPDEVFAHHAKGGQNDFAVWIKEVLGEEKLARRLGKLKSRKGFIRALADCLS